MLDTKLIAFIVCNIYLLNKVIQKQGKMAERSKASGLGPDVGNHAWVRTPLLSISFNRNIYL